MIDIFSKIENVRINCLAENQERFKMLNFRILNKQYNIKIIDSLSFLQPKLEDLSKDLDDNLKFVTKYHFQNKFEFVNKKLENFPYVYVNPKNSNDEFLPNKKYFNNILTMKKINKKEYNKVKLFYKKMKFKTLREYLKCYLISDITLLADVFNNFRKMIFNEFQLDPVKYVSAPSLTKDLALKYSRCKIENIKDVSIFNFVRKTIMGVFLIPLILMLN